MEDEEKKIAIYSRKSKFTGKGESIGNQVELCRDYVRLHYDAQAAEGAEVFEDEGFSGGNMNRPAFQRMMAGAREKRFRAVIVYRLDRISRNISDFSGLIRELEGLGTSFVSIREQFDTASPMGRAMMYISSVFSQLERETIAERIRDNMHELAKTGRWLGGNTPTGYASESVQTVTADGRVRKVCRLKQIPEEAETVRTIFEIFLETDSLTRTDGELLRRRITTKTGKNHSRFSVKGILQNPVYMIADEDAWNWFREREAAVFSDRSEFDGVHGILAYNRTDQEAGRTTVCLPARAWIVCVGQHEGLIPGRLWVAVQRALERNQSRGFRKAKRNEALLTGLLYCSCGSRMYPKLSRGKTPEGKPGFAYVCKRKERSQRACCDCRNCDGNALDGAILDQIRLLEEDEKTFLDQLEKHKRHMDSRKGDMESLKKEKKGLEEKIEGLIDALAVAEGTAVKETVIRRIEKLKEESGVLDQKIYELESEASRTLLDDTGFAALREALCCFRATIDRMTLEQKRDMVRRLIRKVEWDGAVGCVTFQGTEDALEGGQGAPPHAGGV